MEPTLQDILDAITALDAKVTQAFLAIDDVRANLMSHRQDVGVKMTAMDLSMRGEIAVVRENVEALDVKVVDVAAAQATSDAVVTAIAATLDQVKADQSALSTTVATLGTKIDSVSSKQDLADQATADLSLKIDDVNAKLDTPTL